MRPIRKAEAGPVLCCGRKGQVRDEQLEATGNERCGLRTGREFADSRWGSWRRCRECVDSDSDSDSDSDNDSDSDSDSDNDSDNDSDSDSDNDSDSDSDSDNDSDNHSDSDNDSDNHSDSDNDARTPFRACQCCP